MTTALSELEELGAEWLEVFLAGGDTLYVDAALQAQMQEVRRLGRRLRKEMKQCAEH